jgi:ethanolamine utilization protein EutA
VPDEVSVAHDHDHRDELSDADREAVQRAILEHDTLELVTVGVDIGSSTSHLLFARVLFERRGHRQSDRFVVVDRTVEWRSPILLTPFGPDGTIDAHRLARFVQDCYCEAGIVPSEVDSGAVILTGEAIKKRNARAIDEMIAGGSGRFVCATAGHRLECILAAHGSGATELNRRRGGRGLHVDIGGGTTKVRSPAWRRSRSAAGWSRGTPRVTGPVSTIRPGWSPNPSAWRQARPRSPIRRPGGSSPNGWPNW